MKKQKQIKAKNLSFRKILIWVKKETNTNLKNFYILCGAILFVAAGLSIVLDYFTPFFGIWMILRALILIPITLSVFFLGYSIAYKLHKKRLRENPEWVSLRDRFSPTWRNRISIILGAVLIVIAYVSQERVGYTIVSSCILACVIALFAFMRKTAAEQKREELGIVDLRDIEYEELMTEMEKEQKAKKDAKRQKKSQKRYEKWGYKDEYYVEPPDEDDEDDEEDTEKDIETDELIETENSEVKEDVETKETVKKKRKKAKK